MHQKIFQTFIKKYFTWSKNYFKNSKHFYYFSNHFIKSHLMKQIYNKLFYGEFMFLVTEGKGIILVLQKIGLANPI